MNSYRSRNRAMVPLLMLMALEALAANRTNSKTMKPPGVPSAGIIVFDYASSEAGRDLSGTDEPTASIDSNRKGGGLND